ncbi:hypothetical protein [Streptomyces bottropensis]|uniref:hypothetical protein n=1 Tax=Streptomyces bottropensis TaxID=42235 RepID=UPI00368A5BDD
MSVSRRSVLTTAAGAAMVGTASASASASASSPASAAEVAVADRSPQSSRRTLRSAADFAVERIRAVAPQVTAFPVGTRFEKWVYSQNGDWVGGFWPGTLWMAWLHTEDDAFRTWALEAARKLAPRQYDTSTHDLGFLFCPSWVTAWRLTGDDAWRTGAVRAADSLLQRYNPRGRFIRAWGALTDPRNAGRVIIDTMMNLDLLAFAARQTGDPRYLDIAVEHARTTQRVFPRPDGSTPHV